MSLYTKITGAWVDGMAVPVDQAGQSLRSMLRKADLVSLVIDDGYSAMHTVTFSGLNARRLADLSTEPDEVMTESVTGAQTGSAGSG